MLLPACMLPPHAESHVPLPRRTQLPPVGGRSARFQRGHVDAAHVAGLDRLHRAHPARRDRGRLRDGAAVRPLAASPAPHRIRRGSLRSAPPADALPVAAGHPRAGACNPHPQREDRALARLHAGVPPGLRDRVRRPRAPDLRGRARLRQEPFERGGAQLDLVPDRAHGGAGGGGSADRRRRYGVGVPHQRGDLRSGARGSRGTARRGTPSP